MLRGLRDLREDGPRPMTIMASTATTAAAINAIQIRSMSNSSFCPPEAGETEP